MQLKIIPGLQYILSSTHLPQQVRSRIALLSLQIRYHRTEDMSYL